VRDLRTFLDDGSPKKDQVLRKVFPESLFTQPQFALTPGPLLHSKSTLPLLLRLLRCPLIFHETTALVSRRLQSSAFTAFVQLTTQSDTFKFTISRQAALENWTGVHFLNSFIVQIAASAMARQHCTALGQFSSRASPATMAAAS
jgi:hypothetical protein